MAVVVSGTAGDVGTTIVINLGGYYVAGASVTLLAAQGSLETANLGNGVNLGACSVASNGLTAAYQKTGTDFVSGGLWTLWPQIVPPSASGPITGPPTVIYVNPLPPA
jgi:hypothetical protein